MPMGMPYPKGKMSMMSKLMGIESKEHGKKMKSHEGVMKAEAKEYGKRPSSKKEMMKGEMKEHGKKMMPAFMKGKR